MNILISGGHGFLGSYIRNFMKEKGFVIKSVGLSDKNDIIADLSSSSFYITDVYDIVIHAAGKAHVVNPKEVNLQEDLFYKTNVDGTINLLKSFDRSQRPQRMIFISTVAVYGIEEGIDINETSPLNAKSAYGKSKIEAEQIILDWCNEHNIICTILRLPLVIGDSPPGNLGDMVRAIRKGFFFNISGGHIKKSMVLAEDVAKFIIPASEVGGIYNLTDGYHPTFKELSEAIAKHYHKSVVLNLPFFFAWVLAKMGDLIGKRFPINSDRLKKVLSVLTFSDQNARKAFGWNPRKVIEYYQ